MIARTSSIIKIIYIFLKEFFNYMRKGFQLNNSSTNVVLNGLIQIFMGRLITIISSDMFDNQNYSRLFKRVVAL